MMKNLPSKLLIFLFLLIIPIAGRWFWFHRGGLYYAPEIERVDGEKVIARYMDYQPLEEDDPLMGEGHIIIDLSHRNNLEINDLSPLRDRLESRGLTVEAFEGNEEEETLQSRLPDATGLIIVAPTENYTEEEQAIIIDFVEDGGRLLLAADPTRPVPTEEENSLDLFSIFFPTSAVPAINSLANEFGVVYFDDYLYNLNDNEGNYRNVKFRKFAEHNLTDNINTVVLFASHSLRSDGIPLLVGDNDTQSPVRIGETNLAAATLNAEGRVLALGDITFLTAPYHTIEDNDLFLSRISNWMAVDERDRDDLEDFPYLFQQPVDLIQVSGDYLDPRLITRNDELQDVFETADLSLTIRATPSPDHDVLYIGTYDDLEPIQDYLVSSGISVTMLITDDYGTAEEDTEESEDSNQENSQSENEIELQEESNDQNNQNEDTEQDGPTPDEQEENDSEGADEAENENGETDGSEEGSDDEAENELTLEEFEEDDDEETDTEEEDDTDEEEEEQEGPRGIIEIEAIGKLGVEGTTLFITDRSDDRLTLIVLAEDGTTAMEALDRLVANDISDCAQAENITVCSTGEIFEWLGLDSPQQEMDEDSASEEETEEESQKEEDSSEESSGQSGSIFILSDDDGPLGERTGATELEAILGEFYEVTVWSTNEDGVPEVEDITGYDVYIFDSGDYEFDLENPDAFFTLLDVQESGILLIGAQALPSLTTDDYAEINDLSVINNDHPLAAGLVAEDIIPLSESDSGVPAVVIPEDDLLGPSSEEEEVEVIFVRGPESEESGEPALIAAQSTLEDDTEQRLIIATFAFYRLPEDVQQTFALNATSWLMNQE